MINLRVYQADLWLEIKNRVRAGLRRPLVVAPTGSGKTVMFCYLADRVSKAGRRAVILVHRQELLEQTSRTLENFGIPHGIIAAGHKPSAIPLVQVAMVASLSRRLKRTATPDLIIVDEAHHTSASTYLKVINAFPKAHTIGFTATPERLDGKGLGEIFDEIIMGPEVSWLMERGFLSRCKYYAPPQVADLSKVHTQAGDYKKSELADAMSGAAIMGDAVRHYSKLSPDAPAVAFCVTVEHAQNTAKSFSDAGIPAGVIAGDMTKNDRRQVVDDLASGKLRVLTSCEIINEGFDLPVVTTAILLRKTQSLGLHLQQIGRILRPHPDKAHSIVIDHVGNLMKHGTAEQPREWSLDGRPKADRTSDQSDKFQQCQNCYAIFEGHECPECGWIKEIAKTSLEVVDIDLVEFKYAKPSEAKNYQDLVKMAKAKGYKPGWAWHAAREHGITLPFRRK